MVTIDFEKAFDSVSWSFLNKTLHKFNFGDSFIKWVNTFYKDVSSCIMNNGVSTALFPINRGVRLGDPLSPYLFILVLEPLLSAIKEDPTIRGLQINNHEYKLTVFAHDLTTFLHDKISYNSLLTLMDQFGTCAGLKRNEGKTEAYWLGSFHNRHEHLDIKTINKPIKILGIHFTYDRRKCQELNFDTTLTSIKKNVKFLEVEKLDCLGKNPDC